MDGRRPTRRPTFPQTRRYPAARMRHAVKVAALALLCLAVSAPAALAGAHDGGEGLWGETDDKVITNAGFILMIAFPLFILGMTLLQHSLDRRKEARKAAEKARQKRADVRGGW